MTILEYDKAIEDCYNPETGEFNEELFNELQQGRSEKVENLICFYKNVVSMAEAIKEEEAKLAERRKAEENKAKSLKAYIEYALQGEKFKTARCDVSYRKTKSVELSDNFVSWATATGRDDLLSYKEPTASKTAVKAALEAGEDVPAQIVEKMSMNIK